MQLQDWLNQKNISQTELAKALGVTQSAVWLYANKKKRPKGEVAAKIKAITGGEVTFEDFYPVPENMKRIAHANNPIA